MAERLWRSPARNPGRPWHGYRQLPRPGAAPAISRPGLPGGMADAIDL